MKVAAQGRYGGPDVITIVEREQPRPGPGELLIQVHASTVTLADCAFRKADPFIIRFFGGLWRPKADVLGGNVVGVVAAIGEDVTRFAVGQQVHGSVGVGLGGMAEYVRVSQDAAIVSVPEGQDRLGLAGLGYGYLTAMPFIRDEAKVKTGDRVLINGAASSIGVAAIQLARHFGAEVTAVASGRHRELALRLGAHGFIDRNEVDFTDARDAYDVIFDAVGKSSFAAAAPALKAGGIYLTTVPSFAIMALMLLGGHRNGRRGRLATTGLRPVPEQLADMEALNALLETGAVRAVTDRVFPLAEISEAHRYVESETKAGDVLVAMPVADGLQAGNLTTTLVPGPSP